MEHSVGTSGAVAHQLCYGEGPTVIVARVKGEETIGLEGDGGPLIGRRVGHMRKA